MISVKTSKIIAQDWITRVNIMPNSMPVAAGDFVNGFMMTFTTSVVVSSPRQSSRCGA